MEKLIFKGERTIDAMVGWRKQTLINSWMGAEAHDGREKPKNNRNIGPKA